MTKTGLFIFAALAISLAACGSGEDERNTPVAKDVPPLYMLYSPNGEPLNGGPLGKPSCEQALGGWFSRISAGGAHIGKDAFLADARTQFARMDIDHNGYIVSEELDRFREPYRQQAPLKKKKEEDKDSDGQEGLLRGHKGRGKRGGDDANPTDLSFTTADPVMSADTNLDFKVTPDEFLKQANDVFDRLDANHDGFLENGEIMSQCEKKKP